MKIGVYGGAFNPVHYGHLRAAEEIFEMLSLDRMLFIPSGITPFDKPDMETPVHRCKMLEAAVKDNPHFMISKIEVNNRSRSYTVDTLRKLRERYSKSELFFIIGIDAFLDLPHWKQPDRLVEITNMVIISRPGYDFSGLSSSPYLKDVPGRILKELDRGSRSEFVFDISENQKGYLCRITELNISASLIRKLIFSGREIKYLLPESVKSYIISNKLYRSI